MLVQRGQLALDDPLSRYRPEFGAQGKESITVAEVLSHQAGLPGVEAGYADLLDHDAMAAHLAAQAPDAGAGFVCHPITWGWLLDELVRGRTVGRFFADAFGHAGAGGSRHGAWPGRETTFSYLMSEVRNAPDARPVNLLQALSRGSRARGR